MNYRPGAVSLRTWDNGNFVMDHHAANYSENRPSPGKRNPVFRAVVLRSESGKLRTIGFPALRESAKKVWFDPPRPAICTLDGGADCTDCLVLGIWDSGARVRIEDASFLDEFDLLFTSGPRPVRRRCKRVSVRGDVIDIVFKRTTPSHMLETTPAP